jgi:hypothetical protein
VASGGTPVSFSSSLRLVAANQYAIDHDHAASVATDRAVATDTICTGINAVTFVFDTTATGCVGLTINIDTGAVVGRDVRHDADALVVIGNVQGVTANFEATAATHNVRRHVTDVEAHVLNSLSFGNDIKARAANDVAIGRDLSCSISTAVLRDIDSRLAACIDRVFLADTKLQALNENTVTATFDSSLGVRCAVIAVADGMTFVSSSQIKNIAGRVLISRLFISSSDGEVGTSRAVQGDTDTQSLISAATDIRWYFDSSVYVSNDMLTATDTTLTVHDVIVSVLSKLSVRREAIRTYLRAYTIKTFTR